MSFSLDGTATKKNSKQVGHRPSAAFVKWEDAAIGTLMRLREQRRKDLRDSWGVADDLPITTPATLDITAYVKGPIGDAAGYLQAVGDVLDGTRARNAWRKLKLGPSGFKCDYQIVADDALFNHGVSARVVRAGGEQPRVDVVIKW